MATTLQEVEAGVIGFIITESNANQATIESWLASGETEVKTLLANVIKQIPSVKGVAAIVAGPIETAVETAVTAYVDSLIAKETPATLFALYITLLTSLQVKVTA